jgi:hypothetical protein
MVTLVDCVTQDRRQDVAAPQNRMLRRHRDEAVLPSRHWLTPKCIQLLGRHESLFR